MIKLYLDEDVHRKVATALRLKGYVKSKDLTLMTLQRRSNAPV